MSDTGDQFWKMLEPEYVRGMMFCRKLMGDRDHGDDLYQDALLAACTGFSDLNDTRAFRAWFYRIVINTFKNTVRRPWWKRRVRLTPDIALRLSSGDPAETHAARRWLGRAFDAISTEQQALVTLHELEGWSIADLARLYRTGEGTIKARLFRARRRMRNVLIRYAQKSGTPEKTVETFI